MQCKVTGCSYLSYCGNQLYKQVHKYCFRTVGRGSRVERGGKMSWRGFQESVGFQKGLWTV
jgi:hypothetical protein